MRGFLISIIGLLGLSAWAGDARFAGTVLTNSLLPYSITASVNSNVVGAVPITLRPGAGVALRCNWVTDGQAATNTVPVILKFALSLDGTNWPVNPLGKVMANEVSFRVPSQGAPGTNWQTNIQASITSPFRSMKLMSVSNNEEAALIITNFTWWINRYER